MDYVKPAELIANMVDAGARKGSLSIGQLLLRGILSGALLGISTSLAVGANVQTGQPIVGALVFPVGFVMICLLGLELVTGSFALLPIAALDGRIHAAQVMKNWLWVFVGNLIGSMIYAALISIVFTNGGASAPNAVGQAIIKIAEAKTIAYAHLGSAGVLTVFVNAMLCNWMVCLGVAMSMVATSVFGKIIATWMPVVIFFAQGFEHAVVNMFAIPAGMMMGANVSLSDWWLWNQIPVTLGNIVGGFLFTGLALYATQRQPKTIAVSDVMPPTEQAPAA
jgi:formate transporter